MIITIQIKSAGKWKISVLPHDVMLLVQETIIVNNVNSAEYLPGKQYDWK